MSKFSRGAIALLAASAPACILFGVDDLTGGTGAGEVDATTDAPTGDASSPDVVIIADAGSDATAPFACADVDATFCDTFDRDAAIVVGAPWTSFDTTPPCTITVDGTFNAEIDASTTSQNCFLVSNPTDAKNGHFTLDFDMTYTADPSSTSLILLSQIAVALPSVDDGGVQTETFQLFVSGTGSGRIGVLDYYPDAAVSPDKGVQFVPYTVANVNPFTRGSPSCHLTWVIDAVTPLTSATSTCSGVSTNTVATGSKPPHGFASSATLFFGYGNPDVISPAWSVSYDNMVFRALP